MLVSPATFLPSHVNRGCCGEGNSQHVAAESEICTADNISACSFFFFVLAFYKYIYPHAFLEKSEGDIVIASVRQSVHPSVHLSVMLSPPKPLDEIQPNLVCELLT